MTIDPVPQLEQFRLDPATSTFTVQAFSEGLFSMFGHDPVFCVKEFSGEAQFVPVTFENASLRLAINANALSATNIKEKDRDEIERTMRNEVLETSKYPEIIFESNNVVLSRVGEGCYRARVIGDLTLHGVTQKNLWVNGMVTVSASELRVRGQCPIKQTDFRIKLVSVAGGTLKVKNEVKCAFDIVARSVR